MRVSWDGDVAVRVCTGLSVTMAQRIRPPHPWIVAGDARNRCQFFVGNVLVCLAAEILVGCQHFLVEPRGGRRRRFRGSASEHPAFDQEASYQEVPEDVVAPRSEPSLNAVISVVVAVVLSVSLSLSLSLSLFLLRLATCLLHLELPLLQFLGASQTRPGFQGITYLLHGHAFVCPCALGMCSFCTSCYVLHVLLPLSGAVGFALEMLLSDSPNQPGECRINSIPESPESKFPPNWPNRIAARIGGCWRPGSPNQKLDTVDVSLNGRIGNQHFMIIRNIYDATGPRSSC